MAEDIKMLIVDDDESMVRLLTRLISDSFDGRVALNGMIDPVAATHWIEEMSPELVVTDLEMPKVDGIEILKCAKKRNPYCQVIIHSGHLSIAILGEAIELGASDYVPKSLDQEGLLHSLEYAWCRLQRWRQAFPEIAIPQSRPAERYA